MWKAVFLGLLICSLLSCQKKSPENTFFVPTRQSPLDGCMSPELQTCIRRYLKYDYRHELNYCYIYFFRLGDTDYFTMWSGSYEPLLVLYEAEPEICLDYYGFSWDDRHFVLMKRREDKRELPFKPCIGLLAEEDISRFFIKDSMSLRNYCSMRTYRYRQEEEEGYRIQQVEDTVYMDFPGQGMLTLRMLNMRHEYKNSRANGFNRFPYMAVEQNEEERALISGRDTFLIPPCRSPEEEHIDPALWACLRFHQIDYYWTEGYYYHVYFFSKDSSTYFTLWHSPDGPELIMNKSGLKLDYYWFELYSNDIIFIKQHEDQGKLPFQPSISLIPPEDIGSIPAKEFVTGHRYRMRTYRYYYEGEKCRIEGLCDTIYLNFPYLNWVKYEMYGLRRLNRRLGLNPKHPYPKF